MDALRRADVAARVAGWHNRHPLARRITPADVGGIGVVALPFALPAEGDGGAAPAALRPLFGHDWMFRVSAPRLGEWVRRHGRYPLTACAGWPLRQIDAELAQAHRADAEGLQGRTLRHVLTAVIDVAGHRVRVLLAPTPPLQRAAVFGRRVWSPARTGAAAAGAAGLAVALLGGMLAGAAGPLAAPSPGVMVLAQATPAATVPPPARAATAPLPASAPTPEDRTGPMVESEPAASAAAAAAPAATPAAPPAELEAEAVPAAEPDRPIDVPVTLAERAAGTPPLVSIRPRLGEADRRDARAAAERVRLAAVAAALPGRLFALATPAARSREDAQAQQVLMQGLRAQTRTAQPTRLDLMPTRGRWRAVWWPHPDRVQAERLLQAARARGLKVELIEF